MTASSPKTAAPPGAGRSLIAVARTMHLSGKAPNWSSHTRCSACPLAWPSAPLRPRSVARARGDARFTRRSRYSRGQAPVKVFSNARQSRGRHPAIISCRDLRQQRPESHISPSGRLRSGETASPPGTGPGVASTHPPLRGQSREPVIGQMPGQREIPQLFRQHSWSGSNHLCWLARVPTARSPRS
jgi:hypothetical protein